MDIRDKLHKAIDAFAGSNNITELPRDLFSTAKNTAINTDLSLIEHDQSPIVKFLNNILREAIQQHASDIHFEPYQDAYRIRFRLNGLLQEVSRQPIELANFLTARMKVLANLDLSLKRLPQDGHFSVIFNRNKTINFRLNTCPTAHGEKTVLRLLNAFDDLVPIEASGMSEQQRKLFTQALAQPQGMILVTGPTGSGKTMTLYSALATLNTDTVNICTVEDPIEIQFPGINQVQINPKIGLTFATLLRAFLRQDPDIMMIGEIRDNETAECCVKAAQTGHLVLSTLHSNSATETLMRLRSLGISPAYIANTVQLIIAQRLVRRLCEHCKTQTSTPSHVGFIEENHVAIYQPQGCSFCHQGFRGRVGIFELLPLSTTMTSMMLHRANVDELTKQAREENIPSLQSAALDKVRQGLTSLDEINRVLSWR